MHDVNLKVPKIGSQGFAVNETNIARFKKRALAVAIASSMAIFPFCAAEAAGLGKLTVLSALGQPLRAEVEVSATKEELAGMSAQLAAQDAFKQAGIEYPQVLGNLRFALERKASGQAVIKVSSYKPINEPFLDFLVELNWPAGRLVREYTFLLDPPEVADPAARSRSVVDARVVETVRGAAASDFKPSPSKQSALSGATSPAEKPKLAEKPAPAEKAERGAATHVVKRGETLNKIASEVRPEGVSLEQMLVSLFRNNPDAFVGNNLNRLKEGAILNVPERTQVEAITPGEAKKVYQAQTGDWKNYRQKLAAATVNAAPAKEQGEATQQAAGKITAKVEDKALPAEKSKDQVKVGRSEGTGKSVESGKLADEDRIARDKAYKEAQERVALLEKNVADLQKVLELKNQKLAELQQAGMKKEESKPAPAATPAPVAPTAAPATLAAPNATVAPAAAPAPVAAESAKVSEATPAAPATEKPAEKPAEAAPAEAPKPEAAPKPPVAKPKPVTPPPPPPEPELLDTLLEDPVPLLGGVGLLAALLGGFAFYRRRGIKVSPPQATTTPMPSSLGPNSVFRMTGGQSVDTANIPLQTGEFSQTGPGTIDTDEVDPVAEADVYIAYGRDTQAEEILLEALNKDPRRTAIHVKLLEIYASRGSLKEFETLATELYAQTDGQGPDWEKVAAMGATLDPQNPLYPAKAAANSESQVFAAFDTASSATDDDDPFRAFMTSMAEKPAAAPAAPAPVAPQPDFSSSSTLVLQDMPDEAPVVAQAAVEAQHLAAPAGDVMTLDFDFGSKPQAASAPAPVPEAPLADSKPAELPADLALDFDLSSNISGVSQAPTIDFDLGPATTGADQAHDFSSEGTMIMPSSLANVGELDLGALMTTDAPELTVDAVPAVAPAPASAPVAQSQGDGLDFDFSIGQTPSSSEATLIMPSAQDADAAALLDLAPASEQVGSLDFDIDFGKSVFMAPAAQPAFDMKAIDLDLATPATVIEEPASIPEVEPENDSAWDEANTKLDLAKAYEEIGDMDGARELLNEVVADGPAKLAAQAKEMLGKLGA